MTRRDCKTKTKTRHHLAIARAQKVFYTGNERFFRFFFNVRGGSSGDKVRQTRFRGEFRAKTCTRRILASSFTVYIDSQVSPVVVYTRGPFAEGRIFRNRDERSSVRPCRFRCLFVHAYGNHRLSDLQQRRIATGLNARAH